MSCTKFAPLFLFALSTYLFAAEVEQTESKDETATAVVGTTDDNLQSQKQVYSFYERFQTTWGYVTTKLLKKAELSHDDINMQLPAAIKTILKASDAEYMLKLLTEYNESFYGSLKSNSNLNEALAHLESVLQDELNARQRVYKQSLAPIIEAEDRAVQELYLSLEAQIANAERVAKAVETRLAQKIDIVSKAHSEALQKSDLLVCTAKQTEQGCISDVEFNQRVQLDGKLATIKNQIEAMKNLIETLKTKHTEAKDLIQIDH